jgi:hypothetical protein
MKNKTTESKKESKRESRWLSEVKPLSDQALHSSLIKTVSGERDETARVVAHLAEVWERKLHLAHMCSSPYTYAMRVLGYSEHESFVRVSAAKLTCEHPDVPDRIARKKLTLCSAAEAWGAFERNRKEIQRQRKESQPLQKTQASFEEKTRVPKSAPLKPMSKKERNAFLSAIEGKTRQEAKRTLLEVPGNGDDLGNSSKKPPRGKLIPRSQGRSELQATLTSETLLKFNRLRDLLSHRIPSGDPNEILDHLFELGLDRHDPLRQEERRKKREAKRDEKRAKECEREKQAKEKPVQPRDSKSQKNDAAILENQEAPRKPSSSAQSSQEASQNQSTFTLEPQWDPIKGKYIRIFLKAQTRREVWVRDAGACTEVDPQTGVCCGSTRFIDVDHRIPVSQGGTNEVSNLALRCSSHNRTHAHRTHAHRTHAHRTHAHSVQ